jgi:hypothetical protein
LDCFFEVIAIVGPAARALTSYGTLARPLRKRDLERKGHHLLERVGELKRVPHSSRDSSSVEMGSGPSLLIAPADANALYTAAERDLLREAFVRMCAPSSGEVRSSDTRESVKASPCTSLRLSLALFQQHSGIQNAMLAQCVWNALRRCTTASSSKRSSQVPATPLSFQDFVCGCAMLVLCVCACACLLVRVCDVCTHM